MTRWTMVMKYMTNLLLVGTVDEHEKSIDAHMVS